MSTIKKNLIETLELIRTYEKKHKRKPGSVRLLAVSKLQPPEKITCAFNEAQFAFGESYLQEALIKIAALTNLPIEWHFIGPVQSNKTRRIAEHFAWVHSVDNIKIAKRLNDQRPPHFPPLNICLQVNVSGERTKTGLAPNEVLAAAKACRAFPRLKLRGLMTLPAPEHDFVKQRRPFHILACLQQSLIAQDIELDTLSMGMSEDFEAAIAEGATIVRVGTAIFGERPKR